MASVLDHRHFRDTKENLDRLHDEWMHGSTNTSAVAQGTYEHVNDQVSPIDTSTLPPSFHQFIGFSPSDNQHFASDATSGSSGGSGGNGSGGSGGCPSGMCDKGGGHCGSGCACCNNEAELDACYAGTGSCGPSSGGNANPDSGGKVNKGKSKGGKGSKQKHHQKGGGGRAQGAGSIGNPPRLANVPLGATGSSTGASPVMLVLVLGGGVLAVYFIWHKLRKSKAEDKQLDKEGE